MNKFLKNLSKSRLSHAYCLVGGVGESSVTFGEMVRILHVDPNEIYLKSDAMPIAEARSLITWLSKRPLNGKYKLVYINLEDIRNDVLTTLLKTIEEPPDYGIIVLRAANISNVLVTIKSRCQVVWLGGDIAGSNNETEVITENSLELFTRIPDLLKTDTASNILDNWILREEAGLRSGKKAGHLNRLLKIKEYSRFNTNSRLLLEYAVLSGGIK